MTARRPSGSLVGAIVAAVVSLWLGFAVVAAVTATAPRTAAPTDGSGPDFDESAPGGFDNSG